MEKIHSGLANRRTPEELFALYQERTEKLAQAMCWHFQVSGALSHEKEIKSEALMMLWRKCREFNPNLQEFEVKKNLERETFSIFWTALWNGGVTVKIAKDPYDNFWMWSLQAIRGRVLDYLRSEKLITRQQGQPGERPPTLLYKDRFLSGSQRPVSDGASTIHCYFDLMPSPDRADAFEEQIDRRNQITRIMDKAGLTPLERQTVLLLYSEREPTKGMVASEMNRSKAWVADTLKSAMAKMKLVATENS